MPDVDDMLDGAGQFVGAGRRRMSDGAGQLNRSTPCRAQEVGGGDQHSMFDGVSTRGGEGISLFSFNYYTKWAGAELRLSRSRLEQEWGCVAARWAGG